MSYSNATLGANFRIFEKDPETGFVLLGSTIGAPPTDASQFAPGAMVIDRAAGLVYVNRGTAAAPAWIPQVGKYFTVVAATNGTTNVNVFDANGAPCALVVKSVMSIAQDTTAGNITLLRGSDTVCTIAKGVTAGVPVGASSLSNTTYAKGDVCQVDSSTAGNSFVVIHFEMA